MSVATTPGPALERFRDYLKYLVEDLQWNARMQQRFDLSDVVQETLLEAHAKRDQFRGDTEAELAGWLRKILAHKLADFGRRHRQAKRDVRLEQSLEAALEESSSRLGINLAAPQSTPSERAVKNEQQDRLATALAQLPAAQREAVTLHHLQGLPLAETAERMNRSAASAAGLLRRGLKQLRKLMGDGE